MSGVFWSGLMANGSSRSQEYVTEHHRVPRLDMLRSGKTDWPKVY